MRLFPYPFAPYNGGSLSPRTYARGNAKFVNVQALVRWATYNVGGASLGNDYPNFSVITDLSAALNFVPQGWQIMSVYVDNEGVNFPVYVRFPDSQYTISCPPNASGWFPAYTGARSCVISAIGMTDSDIAALAQTAVYFTDDVKVPYLDPEQQTAVEFGLASPTISFGGSGSSISSVVPVPGGAGYASGALAVSGAGGTGAVLAGTIDKWGRFTSVSVTSGGSGYTGAPTITPSGGRTSRAVWSAAGTYAAGTIVQHMGQYYQKLTDSPYNPTPGTDASVWEASGLAVNADAVFSVALTAPSGGFTATARSNFGPRALGDQVVTYIDTLVGSGAFRSNLWGTPFNDGFIYLTSVFVQQISAGGATPNTWRLETSTGDTIMSFQSSGNQTLLNLTNCNIRLPANKNWRLTAGPVSFAMTVSHNFTFTYSPF